MEKREFLYTVGGNITTMEKSMVVPQNIKNRTVFKFLSKKIKKCILTKKFKYDPAISLLGICPREMKSLS